MNGEYDNYYNKELKDALEYQDFVAEELWKIGLPLFNFSSKKYQIKHGENKLGVEIKLDKIYASTENLWIEMKEKSHPNNPVYVNAGIFRNDNSWIYLIGNYETIYIFTKKQLRDISTQYKAQENKTKTSIGFLLPKVEAEKYAAKIIKL